MTILIPFCCPTYDSLGVIRHGSTFDVPYYPDCVSACLPGTAILEVGLLPPGTYTVRQFESGHPETAEVIRSFEVGAGAPAPATVPALGGSGVALLTLFLAVSAMLVLRRRAKS